MTNSTISVCHRLPTKSWIVEHQFGHKFMLKVIPSISPLKKKHVPSKLAHEITIFAWLAFRNSNTWDFSGDFQVANL
jgi:hypothetical protein